MAYYFVLFDRIGGLFMECRFMERVKEQMEMFKGKAIKLRKDGIKN